MLKHMLNKRTILATCFLGFIGSHITAQEIEMRTNGRLILGTHKERTASVASGDIDGQRKALAWSEQDIYK